MTAENSADARMPGWVKALITLAIVVAAAALIWSQLPRGAFATDLDRIGQGQPAVVVVRDVNFVTGAEVMDRLNRVRPDYADRIEFLAAHQGRPDGQEFARRHDVRDGAVVLFDARGRRVGALEAPETEAEIRQLLDRAGPGGQP